MGVKAITINTAADAQAHIFAQDDAAIFHALLGGTSGILPGPNLLTATKISNNLVRIGPGVYSNEGYILRVATGDYQDIAIDNGTTGYNRYDLIVAEFTRSGAVDSHTIKVVKGTATTGTPADPVLTAQDLDASGTVRQEAIYRVRISGTTITQIDTLAAILPNINTINSSISNGIIPLSNCTYASAVSFTVPGNWSNILICSDKLMMTQSGTVKYFYILSASYSASTGLTTVTVTGGSDFSITNAAITGAYFSHGNMPGHPEWLNWGPTYYCDGTITYAPAGTTAKFRVSGRKVHVIFNPSGSLNASGTTWVRATLPIAAVTPYICFSGVCIIGGVPYAALVWETTHAEVQMSRMDLSTLPVGNIGFSVSGSYDI